MDIELTISYLKYDDGWYTAKILEYPGAISEGAINKEEARRMVMSAMKELMEINKEERDEDWEEKETLVLSSKEKVANYSSFAHF